MAAQACQVGLMRPYGCVSDTPDLECTIVLAQVGGGAA